MKNSKVMQLGAAFAALFLLLVGILSIKAASGAAPLSLPIAGQQSAQSGQSAQPGSDQPAPTGKPLVWGAVHSDKSPPLSSIPARITKSQPEADNENPSLPLRGKLGASDNVIQSITGPLTMPTPSTSFEGIPNVFGPLPADTNGDVGRTQYVQIVNSGFEVWTKTGTPVYGPANNNTVFAGFGGVCETRNDGDPVALYDAMADRWVLTWFTSSAPYMECIAVSVTPDATGAYYRYAFPDHLSGNTLGDYPKMSVWPDAYYMTTNEFGGSSGAGIYAYDRSKMLMGDPTATLVYFHSTDFGLLPSDVDSANNPPPAGSPNYLIEWFNGSPGQLAEFKFHVDFGTPANSTFTGPFLISVADFDPNAPSVPEPNTTTLLDNLSDRMMFRFAYRNFGSYESLVVNHTVNASGVDGIRWYELRDPNNPAGASVFQQGTYAPGDGLYRWMGSIAQDRMGDMMVGFSAGNSTTFPSIRYAGRLVGDPLGQLAQGEATLLAGTGSEDYPAAHRWGDYSAMQVDPVDDCTFWFTTMYFQVTGERDWKTHIGSFKFPGCTAQGSPTPVASPTGPAPTNTPVLPTPTECPNSMNATGSITNTDSIQTGRLGLFDPKSSCATAKSVAGVSDTLTRHYDSYTYTNSTASAECVTVSITQSCSNNAVQSVTYLGSFNPSNVQANYLADGGASGQHFSYSFTLPAGQTAVVVVVEVSPNLGCETYDISINPCVAGATTPTPVTTPTQTPIETPSPTATIVCVGTTYQIVPTSGATMIPATNDIGNHCDDCVTNVNLPFPVAVYGTPYTSANVGSNGLLDFNSTQANIYTTNCLPVQSNNPQFASTLFPYYDDLRTDIQPATHGIYSSTIGTAPNRQFVLEWHTTYFFSDTAETNFEVILNENSPVISVIYGQNATEAEGANPSTGIQLNLGQYSAYSCHTDIPAGTRVDYVPTSCETPTLTPVPPTFTPTHAPSTSTPTHSPPTNTPTAGLSTSTAVPVTATPTSCTVGFRDVPSGSTFYTFIRCLACKGLINGYPDGTFRPNNDVTRGQLSKIVANAAGFSDNQTTQMFQDVPVGSTFYQYIGRLASRGFINGYPCGAPPAGQCVPPGNLPYFLPNANSTRGQISKIVSNARGFNETPTGQQFQDVGPNSPFYTYIYRLVLHQVMSGYPCGTPPAGQCVPPSNRPYFLPNNNATRGQTSKIVSNTFFPDCNPPEAVRH